VATVELYKVSRIINGENGEEKVNIGLYLTFKDAIMAVQRDKALNNGCWGYEIIDAKEGADV
jgi:hypothetical protein